MHPSCSDRAVVRLVAWGCSTFDCFKVSEHVFAKSLAVAAFVMMDTPVSWTFLNQNCC